MSIKNGMHVHFDCFSGISGDMVLGAFNDMGVPTQWLISQIGKLGIDNVEIAFEDVKKNGIGSKKANIIETSASHARTFKDILRLIENGEISEFAKIKAKQIFTMIAEAESHIHRCKLEDVHFHEVGALDSIVDIVGAALCLDYLNIETVSSSVLPLGSGFVECSHGRLPVPAPATLEILKGIPVHGGQGSGEMVTPTGAAIIATLAQTYGPIPPMQIERVGYGSGSIDREAIPNLLRIVVGRHAPASLQEPNDDVYVVETNIDDMNPELFGYLMEKLLSDGALDVCFMPVIMKKNRPGTKVEVLCSPEKREKIAHCLLTETSTAGIRYRMAHRQTLKRSFFSLKTPFGDIRVKEITDPTGQKRHTPEYDDCKNIAHKHGIPLQRVYQIFCDAIKNADIPTGVGQVEQP